MVYRIIKILGYLGEFVKKLFCIVVFFLFLIPDLSFGMDTIELFVDNSVSMPYLSFITPTNAVIFALDGPDELIFSWENGKFRVQYPEGKLDEAGKVFVEWLKQYMDKESYCK